MQIDGSNRSNSLAPAAGMPPLSSSPSHHPTLPWSNGIPSPPRILVPPPTLINDPVHRSRYPRQPLSFGGQQNDVTTSLSSSQLLANSGILPTTLQDWRYESRREAQQILPHLYLGPLSAAKDLDYLRRENITLLIAVRNHITARARLLNAYNEIAKDPELKAAIRFESVDVSGNAELIASFPIASKLIDDHLYRESDPFFKRRKSNGLPAPPENPGKTLIYCESGNERSAAVCAAYIMQHINCSAVQAIQVIQGRRFCVCFDDAMKYLLTGYEPIWMARRDVEMQRLREVETQATLRQPIFGATNFGHSFASLDSRPVAAPKKSKRGIEEAYDDEEMGDGDPSMNIEHDAARFEKREGIAPFSDSQHSVMSLDDQMDD
ncbi:hypothetical protein H072_2538 [Dactylellina haptotyla CBS 200.50]|uniref:Tyrosine specific protein phosphatases domain-containing protein n=1 Tax=Dactylellina haptotyla (strain CBS 200.50) TaxID=1284197 RepID=S8AR04_DACHA|nr:hypothetical protein H072_2538 [Dactylellina haptotyla CBS 200.50]